MPLRISVKNGNHLTIRPGSNFRIGLLTQDTLWTEQVEFRLLNK